MVKSATIANVLMSSEIRSDHKMNQELKKEIEELANIMRKCGFSKRYILKNLSILSEFSENTKEGYARY